MIGVIGNGAIYAPLLIYVSRWFDRRRGAAIALISSGQYIAGVVWPAVFEQGIARFGWQSTMLAYAAVVLLVIPPFLFLLAQPPAPVAAGRAMIAIGVGVGFLFAVFALAISVVSFPMLLDRDVSLEIAIRTSMQTVAANPGPMAVWGMIVTAGLVAGSLPALIGLVIVLPILGHATWHLYRHAVPRQTGSLARPAASPER